DDIGVREEALHDFEPAGRLEVHRDAALVPVEHHERRRLALYRGFGIAARVVAARKLFHLDHVRAHVGEQQSAGRPGHDLRELDDLDALQRSHGAQSLADFAGHPMTWSSTSPVACMNAYMMVDPT